ncbi:TlpA family protein disulfide reductase [Porphyromonadaceae bacterium OttesenSCG-928-L07]|nr:TlpA family protein disulfide reductase [Porphyromonadaceae bacterium OttesenSCG-928-L07]MDL2252302.1 TlpA family protein disulfide reductase [Odoribacter sp. OttesenSCG-928-J03]MDL2331174.1 TlpA family protein disulfide reductase [Odoribacter sp. OttesenSCG-928-A06]
MKYFLLVLFLWPLFISCDRDNYVRISGQIVNADSVISVYTQDSIYNFSLDDDNFFSGKIYLNKASYVSLYPKVMDIYLNPGEDLEIYADFTDVSGTIHFRGTLGGVNNYMHEQERVVFFNNDYYELPEEEFVEKISKLIEERTHLLMAKNFNMSFTELEKQRIRYAMGEKLVIYPFYHKQLTDNKEYEPGKGFFDLLATFPISMDELMLTNNYRKFVLNYVYFRGGQGYDVSGDYADLIADFILTTFSETSMRDFLLSEVLVRYIWENNGIENADYLLKAFKDNYVNAKRYSYIQSIVERCEKLLPGCLAPDFALETINGQKIKQNDYKGRYLYMGIWATWCEPCKRELGNFKKLSKKYRDKNIVFMTVATDGLTNNKEWKELISQKDIRGVHAMLPEGSKFNEDYMVVSVPRFIVIDPSGKIVSANAERPSGKIDHFLDSLDI